MFTVSRFFAYHNVWIAYYYSQIKIHQFDGQVSQFFGIVYNHF